LIEADVKIRNRLGLHARAAARFVHVANRFESHIVVARDGARADGKSILGLLTLAASRGSCVQLSVDGPDEQLALAELVALIEDRFGEGE